MGSLALRPGDSLTIHEMALSIGFRIFSLRPSCYSSYGALTFTPVGLSPTVHPSLRWTHTCEDLSGRRIQTSVRIADDPLGPLGALPRTPFRASCDRGLRTRSLFEAP